MREGHPDDLDLLAHVDEDVRTSHGREVAAHVAACRSCQDTVRELEAAKAALRAAPRFELPADRRAAISSALDARMPARRSYVSPLRFATVLAPVAVVAALAFAVVQLDGGGGGDGGDEAAGQAAERADPRAAEGEGEGEGGGGDAGAAPTQDAQAAPAPVRRVAGPAAEVVTMLRSDGFTARLSGGRVIVSDATPDAVVDALRGRPAGPVPVLVE